MPWAIPQTGNKGSTFFDVAKEIKYPGEFRSRYAMFVNCNTSINNREYRVRRQFDREPSRIPVKSKGSVSQLMDDLDLINSVDRAGRGDG